VAAIGCGVQPVPPGFATFFGEFHWTPLQKIKQKMVSEFFWDVVLHHWRFGV